jgi:hypothetical protein
VEVKQTTFFELSEQEFKDELPGDENAWKRAKATMGRFVTEISRYSMAQIAYTRSAVPQPYLLVRRR